MPIKGWIEGPGALELIDHHWNNMTRCTEGTTATIAVGEVFAGYEPIPFRKRLYSVEELTEIYNSVAMALTNTFKGNGKPGRPRNTQYEVFIEATKSSELSAGPPTAA